MQHCRRWVKCTKCTAMRLRSKLKALGIQSKNAPSGASQTKGFRPQLDVFFPSIAWFASFSKRPLDGALWPKFSKPSTTRCYGPKILLEGAFFDCNVAVACYKIFMISEGHVTLPVLWALILYFVVNSFGENQAASETPKRVELAKTVLMAYTM